MIGNDKISKLLKEVLAKAYDTFPETRGFISNNLMEISSRENVPVDQVFFSCFRFSC